MRKAITPVIALVLLLMMTVAAAGLAYVFMADVQESTQEAVSSDVRVRTEMMSGCISFDHAYENKAVIRNCGTGVIDEDSLVVLLDGGSPVNFTMSPFSINAKETATVTLYSLWKYAYGEHTLKFKSGMAADSDDVVFEPAEGLVAGWGFDEGSGTTVDDESGNGNDGTMSGTIIGDFENTLDGFGLNCGGLPTTSFISGKIGSGMKIWSTGGDGLACAFKPMGALSAGYSVFFYGKGFVRSQFYDGGTASYVEDMETGCRTPDGTSNIDVECNGGNPYTNWRLFRLVAYRNSAGASLYVYNNANVGEAGASYYDFITEGPAWVDGKFGKGLEFDGVDDYVEIPDDNSMHFGTASFTISMWAKTGNPAQNRDIFLKGNSAGEGWILLRQGQFGPSTAFWTQYHEDAGNTVSTWPYDNVLANNWKNYVATIDRGANELLLYYNGKLNQTRTITGNPSYSSTDKVTFAQGRLSGGYWEGAIDDVMIWNRALTPDETVNLKLA